MTMRIAHCGDVSWFSHQESFFGLAAYLRTDITLLQAILPKNWDIDCNLGLYKCRLLSNLTKQMRSIRPIYRLDHIQDERTGAICKF
jgi:hypothetical protein